MNAKAPAKKAAAPAAPAPKKAAVSLDFTALQVTDVAKTEIKHERGSQLDNSPVMAWLKESYENDQAKAVPVPSQEHAEALHTLLRSGAARLNIGVKVVITDAENGGKLVKFLGKEKRAYKPKKATA